MTTKALRLGWVSEHNDRRKHMDTLFIVTQMVMAVAICLLMYFTISTWLMMKMNSVKKEKPTKVILMEKEKEEKPKRTRKKVI